LGGWGVLVAVEYRYGDDAAVGLVVEQATHNLKHRVESTNTDQNPAWNLQTRVIQIFANLVVFDIQQSEPLAVARERSAKTVVGEHKYEIIARYNLHTGLMNKFNTTIHNEITATIAKRQSTTRSIRQSATKSAHLYYSTALAQEGQGQAHDLGVDDVECLVHVHGAGGGA